MLHSPATTSKILPLICPKPTPRNRATTATVSNHSLSQKIVQTTPSQSAITISSESNSSLVDNLKIRPQKFPAAGVPPYIPVRHCNPHHRIAPPVTIRNAIPVFSAPPRPSSQPSMMMRSPVIGMVPPVCVRQVVPVYTTPVQKEELPVVHPTVKEEDPRTFRPSTARGDVPSVSRAAAGRLEESKFSNLPLIRSEEPLGSKLLTVPVTPDSEVPAIQVELPSSEIASVRVVSPVTKVSNPTATSNASAEETGITVQDKLLKEGSRN